MSYMCICSFLRMEVVSKVRYDDLTSKTRTIYVIVWVRSVSQEPILQEPTIEIPASEHLQ
jgi:hypothetical protein